MAIADQSKLECIQWQQVGRGYTAENYSRRGQVAKTGYANIILFKVAAQHGGGISCGIRRLDAKYEIVNQWPYSSKPSWTSAMQYMRFD